MRRLMLAGIAALSFSLCTNTAHAAELPPIDLNWATAAQLEQLPGVGKKRAEAIVEHRRTRPFKRASELMKVRGFGARTFMRLRPLIIVSSPVPLPEASAKRSALSGGKEALAAGMGQGTPEPPAGLREEVVAGP